MAIILVLPPAAMLRRTWREVHPGPEVRELAEDRLERHELPAAGALQLAAALVWCNRRPSGRHFICLDRKLRMAARAEGFTGVELWAVLQHHFLHLDINHRLVTSSYDADHAIPGR